MHRARFWLDFLSVFPFSTVVLAGLGLEDSGSNTARYVALLQCLKLVGGWLGGPRCSQLRPRRSAAVDR